MDLLPGLVARWLHITSIAIVVGGFFFLRFAARGSMPYPKSARTWIIAAIAGLVGSGLYNLLTKDSFPPGYHMWFGIKALLALHVIAVAIVATKEGFEDSRRARLASGLVYSGLAIIAISAYLRWMTLHP